MGPPDPDAGEPSDSQSYPKSEGPRRVFWNESDTTRQAAPTAEVTARLLAADRTAAVPASECPSCGRIARELRRQAERHMLLQLAEHGSPS